MSRRRAAERHSGNAGAARARRRALERRSVILRAAGRAFRRHGFARTGMREIAREAGLSPANLYYYFRGKNHILAFCQDHALDLMLESVRRARARRASVVDRLETVIRAQVLCMLDDLAGAAAHLEIDALPPATRGRIIRKRDRYERAVRGLIEEGTRGGFLVARDPALAARAILGAVNWSARWYDPEGERTPMEIADLFSTYLVRGLKRRLNGGTRR